MPGTKDTDASGRHAANDAFVETGNRVGAAGLVEVAHHHSGLRFVVVPGGTFRMGLDDAERRNVIRDLGIELERPGRERVAGWLEEVLTAAQPPREVVMAPFLCARHPVPDALVPDPLRGRSLSIDVRDYFPDVAAWDDGYGVIDDEDLGDDAPEWMREELEMRAGPGAEPVMVNAREATDLLGQAPLRGLRLMTEAEWEYVAGAGGERRWLDDPGVESLHPFGIWGLFFGTWVADVHRSSLATTAAVAKTPETTRGSAWRHYPFQDTVELIDLLCARRSLAPPGAHELFGMHLAADL